MASCTNLSVFNKLYLLPICLLELKHVLYNIIYHCYRSLIMFGSVIQNKGMRRDANRAIVNDLPSILIFIHMLLIFNGEYCHTRNLFPALFAHDSLMLTFYATLTSLNCVVTKTKLSR